MTYEDFMQDALTATGWVGKSLPGFGYRIYTHPDVPQGEVRHTGYGWALVHTGEPPPKAHVAYAAALDEACRLYMNHWMEVDRRTQQISTMTVSQARAQYDAEPSQTNFEILQAVILNKETK